MKTKAARIRWNDLSYNEMIAQVKKLAGPKPSIPTDIKAPEWSPQALQVLKERYFLKMIKENQLKQFPRCAGELHGNWHVLRLNLEKPDRKLLITPASITN